MKWNCLIPPRLVGRFSRSKQEAAERKRLGQDNVHYHHLSEKVDSRENRHSSQVPSKEDSATFKTKKSHRLCDRQHRSGRGDDVEQNTCLITTPTRKCGEEDYDKHKLLNGSKQHCCSCSCNGTTTDIPTTPRYKNSQLVPQSDENSNPITNPQPPCSYQRSQHDYTYHRCDSSNIPCSHHVGHPGSFGGTPHEFLTAATAGSPLGMPVGVVAVERSVWREMESELVQMRTLCHALQVHISTTQTFSQDASTQTITHETTSAKETHTTRGTNQVNEELSSVNVNLITQSELQKNYREDGESDLRSAIQSNASSGCTSPNVFHTPNSNNILTPIGNFATQRN
ncbi:uncharacterized protein LOC134839583 [Symsagittifera roscoffensis]|uniref:uncharacterized protein LOC134839583 n=1 Tax=Symsagittifera roscoffensis TaxID=84072 RepID=UPI00307BE03C